MEATQGRTSVGADFKVVLFTGRPSVRLFFNALDGRRSSGVNATVLDVSESTVARSSSTIDEASVAVVDAALDPAEALGLCLQLRTLHRELPIALLFCCPHAATSESLRPFLDIGVGSFLDLQLSAEQTLAALRAVARGHDVVRVHLSEDSSKALFGNKNASEQLTADDLTLLRLVALGMTDHEIGAQMCLSHHTIKHRIERLRRRQHVRNRVQLAAFAARLESLRGVRLT